MSSRSRSTFSLRSMSVVVEARSRPRPAIAKIRTTSKATPSAIHIHGTPPRSPAWRVSPGAWSGEVGCPDGEALGEAPPLGCDAAPLGEAEGDDDELPVPLLAPWSPLVGCPACGCAVAPLGFELAGCEPLGWALGLCALPWSVDDGCAAGALACAHTMVALSSSNTASNENFFIGRPPGVVHKWEVLAGRAVATFRQQHAIVRATLLAVQLLGA